MKLMVYSHDAFGLGNIRRMLAICQYLLKNVPDASILVISGSPALHSLRLPTGLDYIKLPCIGRDESGVMGVKYLETSLEEAVKLRSDLILTAVRNFKPDLILVDKKPDGLQGELKSALNYLSVYHPQTRLVLLLRDILDRPDVTVQQWQQRGYYDTIQQFYDQVWVVGTREIFDVCQEYRFPESIARKTRFCGYIRREAGLKSRHRLRQDLQIQPDEFFVLVTPGGGADGYRMVDTYLSGLALSAAMPLKTLIVSGPEMPVSEQAALRQRIEDYPTVQMQEFTDDMVSYMDAADVVVSMGGYNTVGEILSLKKRAVIIPRVAPVEEQWVRAERMAKRGLFQVIHPQHLTPEHLMHTLMQELYVHTDIPASAYPEMEALPWITKYLMALCRPGSPILQVPDFSSLISQALEVVPS